MEREQLERKISQRDHDIRQLEALDDMKDKDEFEDWTLYEALKSDFGFGESELSKLFKGEDDGPFRARHARRMILEQVNGDVGADGLGAALAAAWVEK
jgi:hypothetical protein